MLDENQVYKRLCWIYNFIFFGAVIITLCFYYFSQGTAVVKELIMFQTIAILALLICIPAGLKLYSVNIKALRDMTNKEMKLSRYLSWHIVRLALIEVPLFLCLAVYFLTNDNSMLFGAGIAVLALIFCKPNRHKMYEELGM